MKSQGEDLGVQVARLETLVVALLKSKEGPTIELAAQQFMEWAEKRYVDAEGKPTHTIVNFDYALRPLRKLWGSLQLAEFSPNKLRAVQEHLIREGLTRQGINQHISKIRQFLNWCVGRELVSGDIARDLEHVESVARGQAPEAPPREPVKWETVEATLPHLSPLMRSFVLVLWHTGARVGELRYLTTGMIDRSGDVWKADLYKHKTAYRGKKRFILFGPLAQAAICEWLMPFKPDAIVFSPKRADDRSAIRGGPRATGEIYHINGPQHAIARACDLMHPHPTLRVQDWRKLTAEQQAELRAWRKIHRWSLAQIRHSKATRVTEEHGIEAARINAGHSSAAMTAHYARTAILPAVEAARKSG